ncbi:Glyoxylate/hydroxypyruvate reductase B [Hartmannibacter diazotrophicus]|uniref:Glyoxylate/hydroxypyruvate reductase B n=1 Tax=Hartmannibacter diazotrophicus TaxID=1482074 RepID=A0A2C9D2G8_9HYPH|nr:2-hydroxyacid dehydrogenase [Hartmannibacter diazotrophicus]SON54492.1 Glyoxylate/hydroxypyruvate reductase B [Hartmannibacter diazotrophicus]
MDAEHPPISERPDILLTTALPAWDMEPLEAAFTVHKVYEAADKAAFLAEVGPHIRAIATGGGTGASADLINALPALEIITVYGVGIDAVDLAAARARGIRVTNTPDVLTDDVADLAVGMTLALLRKIPEGDAYVRSGAWGQDGPMGLVTRLSGKKAGIAGFGRIGEAIARRLAGFDMEIGYYNRSSKPDIPYPAFATPADLAAWCDVLVVAVAGGAGTTEIIDWEVLEALGPEGWLVNISRGTTVDEGALIELLEKGAIAGAALDVFLNEPHVDPRFAALSNVLLMPHHASATVETRQAMGQLMRDNLTAHFAGKPLPTPVL